MTHTTASKKKMTSPAEGPSPAPHHKILSLEVTGGFLDGIHLDFADGLNCIIGGRGTGKTTILEFLRYGLNAMPDRDSAPKQYGQIEKLIAGNLGSGRLKITVETKEGLKYVVERAADEDIAVFDEQGEPIEAPPGAVIDAAVYSQNEIEDIASTPHFQLNLIDKFVKDDVAEVEHRLRIVGRDLDHNAGTISKLDHEIRDISGGQGELKLIQDRVKMLQPVKGDVANILQAEVNKRAVRDKETRLMERLSNYIAKVSTELDAIRSPFTEKTATALKYIETEFVGQDNAALVQKIHQDFSRCVGEASAGMSNTAAALSNYTTALAKSTAELARLHKQQEQKYQEILQKHQADRGQAQEQAQLHKKLNELQEKKRELEEKTKILKSKQNEREALLKTLSELRDERWKIRQDVAKTLNKHLEPDIRVQIDLCGDRTAYKELLRDYLKGKSGWYKTLVEKIGDEIAPSEFAELIQKGDADDLVERLNIEIDKAQWLIEQLRAPDKLFRVQTIEVDDKPSITLKDGEEYKDASALSIGQKCTTILPILLWGSTSPLIVDQPEDNLDNNFIYKTVVKRIETAQKDRQIIFVTHNPNIPVLGEAARIFGLKSDGQKGSLDKCGTVDQVKAFIETFLEGGRDAFIRRKDKYGIRDK